MALTINHQTNDISASSGSMTLDGAAVGRGGADLYAAETTGSTEPTSSGTRSIAIGSGAVASGQESISIGKGSNASGTNSTTIAGEIANYGGTGNDSFSVGWASRASSTRAYAFGYQAYAYGTNAMAMGKTAQATANYSISIGADSQASQQKTIILGYACYAAHPNAISFGENATARSSGNVATRFESNFQSNKFFVNARTTDATATEMRSSYYTTSASSHNKIMLPNNTLYAFKGTVLARCSDPVNQGVGAWEIKGLIRKESSSSQTVLIDSSVTAFVSGNTFQNNNSGMGVALSADTSYGALVLTVTGISGLTIRWSAVIDAEEVST